MRVEVATGPPPKNCMPLPGGALFELGNPRNAGRVGPGDANGDGKRRRVPYWMTVGVPVTVQPGTVTELYPDKDGSPNSAPALTSKFGLHTSICHGGVSRRIKTERAELLCARGGCQIGRRQLKLAARRCEQRPQQRRLSRSERAIRSATGPSPSTPAQLKRSP